MIGVRRKSRGSGVLGIETISLIALILAALGVSQTGHPPVASADEPGSGFRRARRAPADALDELPFPELTEVEPPKAGFHRPRSAQLTKKIQQTANPFRDDESEGADVPAAVPRKRERLTGPVPELENVTEPLADILVEGNKTISSDEILKKIKSRAGRPPDPKMIKEDVRALHVTRWFFQVEPRLARNDKGPVLVFKVIERPMVHSVEYKGNKKIKAKDLAELTGLKIGSPYDVGANKESARRIESHYHEKGFLHARVELEAGGSAEDRDVIFKIEEGPKVHVSAIRFKGNKEIAGDVLKTQVKTKTRILWVFGGTFDPTTVPEDVAALKQYYHSLGYFDARIASKQLASDDKSKVTLEYQIAEGARFKVRNVQFVGNRVISEDDLRAKLRLLPNQYFNERFLTADKEKITAQYGELGRIFARIEADPLWPEESGLVDVVYKIDEDRPYRVGKVHVHIQGDHPHTKESVILTRLRFRPGQLASREKIKKSEQALKNTQIFAGPLPGAPNGPHIDVAIPDPPTRKYDDESIVRGQSQNFGNLDAPPSSPRFDDPPFEFDPSAEPPALFDEQQPPGFIDTHVYVNETQTGRLNFGVGVNSNAGLIGSVVLEENNFDIMRPPTSFADIMNGTAWRGGGQQFRIEAVPGNQLSRYLISWRDPYFMEQNVSVGGSAFYYTRFFPNWREQRTGGRITAGRQFSPVTSGSLALRLENVDITNPSIPTPPSLQAVLGNNFLSTVRGNLIHDTRDSAFIPGKGHYLEAAYEQGFGQFTFPKFDFDARQYFTLRERPDGGNRHIVATSAQLGFTDNSTPIFERYYAGGFQSFRGFAFYGVTPRENGVRTGGRFQALGSLEYLLPVSADDMIQMVAFSDMGTVQDEISLSQYRLTVGAGLRLTIPAMGPTPIALDLGFPILKQGFDTTQVFAFYVGVLR
ncbi:MAG: hypothetical protein EXS05_19395 [Planctomycetaceae bacterium]|nr:hypothetical protein [Planctomycetaceae bacterium]